MMNESIFAAGHEGEHLARIIRFPCVRELISKAGTGGTYTVNVKKANGELITVDTFSVDDDNVCVDVTNLITNKTGTCRFQIKYVNGTAVAKSEIYARKILPALQEE